ncbi:MAG: hypothetical protein ACFFBP_16495 [Promethearchaeota archaeon]
MLEKGKVLVNIKKIKENTYLIIPMFCIIIWAILYLISSFYNPHETNFQFIYFDFQIWYRAGQQIYRDPSKLYSTYFGYDISYTWTPCWATLFAISISLMPYAIGYFTLYVINIIVGMLFIREFNKILMLLKVKRKLHRFLFLIIISNGFLLLNLFRQNQTKFIVGLILFFILRKEIQYRKGDLNKDLKYNLINYGLFVFALGMAPYFIYLLLIYMFHDIKFKDLLKKENIKIYSIVVFMFIFQNILFLIYPNLIFEFLEGFFKNVNFFIFYLNEWIIFSDIEITLINIIFSIILFVITLILIINKKLTLEVKFGYFSLFAIFFGLFANRVLMILLPSILILFIPFMKQDETGFDFIKENIILLTGFLAIAGIYLNVNPETIYLITIFIIPASQGFGLMLIIYLRWIILLILMLLSFLLLYMKNRDLINEYYLEL